MNQRGVFNSPTVSGKLLRAFEPVAVPEKTPEEIHEEARAVNDAYYLPLAEALTEVTDKKWRAGMSKLDDGSFLYWIYSQGFEEKNIEVRNKLNLVLDSFKWKTSMPVTRSRYGAGQEGKACIMGPERYSPMYGMVHIAAPALLEFLDKDPALFKKLTKVFHPEYVVDLEESVSVQTESSHSDSVAGHVYGQPVLGQA